MIDFNKEIIFASSDPEVSREIGNAEKSGKIMQIAPRIYSPNLRDAVERIIKRHFFEILKWRFPNAVISHRSASELRPTETGNFFVTSNYTKRITDLKGFTLNVMAGKPALDSDVNLDGIYVSSEWRWMLENMQTTRKKGGESKAFPVEFIEDKLEKIIIREGEAGINKFRDKAKTVAEQLDFAPEFEKLNALISALLSTHNSAVLSSASAKARATGMPFDAQRVELFEILYDKLKDYYFPERPDKNDSEESFLLFSFFEAYFSNYIEGTKFTIDDARHIVETGIAVSKRVKDSHDILGTFHILSNRQEMTTTPSTADELIKLLKNRHLTMMLERAEEVNAGMFKNRNNRAGSTEFVEHTLVEGTLRQGFNYYAALTDPMAKALFIMFMVSEIHPFTDGNGRISWIMGNAELFKSGQSRIIVPTVYREDYLMSLKKMTNRKEPDTYIRVMDKLQHFSNNIFGESFDEVNNYLKETNACKEPSEAKLNFIDRSG
ncbi:Fic family protein [Candidatus Symbiothrix dinenymphae]|uniref:Fic family protein n=1 Tax=Candidatus Symbiothrix dinenymphae TaxID=467085 RepID=UPI00070290D3|nr:Fic family protein [Candidatus Symbiothrix dinenymphae]